MAKILAAGGRRDGVATSGTVTEITTTNAFDSAYADCALNCAGSAAFWTQTFTDETTGAAVDVVTGETVYCHFEIGINGSGSGSNNSTSWSLENSAGEPLVALRQTSTNTIAIFGNTGTPSVPVWTQIGSTRAMPGGTSIQAWDIELKLGSPHEIKWIVNGVIHASGSFTQGGITSLRRHRGFGNSTGDHRYSQIMATEGISTVGGKVRYSRANGAGTNSSWTGVIGSINEAIDNIATLNTSATAGQKQSYTMGDVTLPSGFAIKAVFHGIFAKNDGVAPANIKSLLRSGGVDYSSSDLSGIGVAFTALIQRYDVDPATGINWTDSGFNAIEAGFESAT